MRTKTWKVALAGCGAIAEGTYLPYIGRIPNVEMVAVFDIILVCAEILRRGIHVVMEKPLAASMQEANLMVRAMRESGAELTLNWPATWYPSVRKAYELEKF